MKGWPKRRTWYTRALPVGCRPCLQGKGSNLAVTMRCTRECFFCFNPKPRSNAMSVHGKKVASCRQAASLLAGLGIKSVGLSGGEPLLERGRVLALVRALRRKLGPGLRLDLYTNGDLLTVKTLRALKTAGVDGLRLNLAANNYQLMPLRRALKTFADTEIEIPVLPEHKDRVLRLMTGAEGLGCRHLILHELFVSPHNRDALAAGGYRGKPAAKVKDLTWSPVSGSEQAALEILREALKRKLNISVYYCSTGTQQWIAERALSRAARQKPKSAHSSPLPR